MIEGMKPFLRLSVIINTYERPAALAQCLAALARQRACEPFEVVVVDDGGRADLGDALRAAGKALPVRLERIGHAGRGAARNRGMELARGRRVLFLGDDVIAAPDCVAAHQATEAPLRAVLGPYPLRSPRGSPPFRRWAEPNPQQEIRQRQDAGFWFFATGNLSVERRVLLELGGFDPRFTLYGWEDIDLGLRFERAGGRLIFEERAAGVHEHPPLSRARLWRREFEMGFTAWQFWEKWAAEEEPRIAKMRFWGDPAAIVPGPPWRRRLGEALIALLDAVAPGSALNGRLYERMIFARRLAGVAASWRQAREREEMQHDK